MKVVLLIISEGPLLDNYMAAASFAKLFRNKELDILTLGKSIIDKTPPTYAELLSNVTLLMRVTPLSGIDIAPALFPALFPLNIVLVRLAYAK